MLIIKTDQYMYMLCNLISLFVFICGPFMEQHLMLFLITFFVLTYTGIVIQTTLIYLTFQVN
jgi:hypothetical protein